MYNERDDCSSLLAFHRVFQPTSIGKIPHIATINAASADVCNGISKGTYSGKCATLKIGRGDF
jgi:hypothetical protein